MTHRTLALITLTAAVLSQNASSAEQNPEWTRPYPPFRIIANLYWVGSYDLSTYLVTTPEGHILVNTGIGDTATQIEQSVEALGFRLADVKVLTATHGHYDHVAGLAELKRKTGARVVIHEADRALLETGGQSDFAFGKNPRAHFEPVTVDQTFANGGTITLGGTTIVAHHHPGHTKGATSFSLDVDEGSRRYRVLIANMGSINPGVRLSGMPGYPSIGDDYARTFAAQKAMVVDIFLASHASQFRLHDKHTPGAPYQPDRFVDPKGFQKAVQDLEATYLAQRANEKQP